MAEKNPSLAALVQAGYSNDASIQGASYLDYYRRKYGSADPNAVGRSQAAVDQYNQGVYQAEADAVATGQRRTAEANAQGYTGQTPDITDSFIQQAAQQQRLRQKVGVNRAGSFLAPTGGF